VNLAKTISALEPSVVVETSAAQVSVSGMKGRFSLRARGDLGLVNTALGLTLPDKIGTRATAKGIEAIRLGPDEWTLVVETQLADDLRARFAEVYAQHPHSLTDISVREVTLIIAGAQAGELLTIGCPRDIASIGVGEARRTLFDGVSVVIWCDAPDRYRMDVWNSFAPFVAQTLETGCKELAAEVA